MTPSQRIAALKRMVDEHGAAQVSAWLGYRDTRAVKIWIKNKRIPGLRIRRVDAIINFHTQKDDNANH